MKPSLATLAIIAVFWSAFGSEPNSLSSPDGNIEARLAQDSPLAERVPALEIRYRGKPLITGVLGLSLSGTNLLEGSNWRGSRSRTSDSTYKVLWGKSNPVRDHFSELGSEFVTGGKVQMAVRIVVRAYDDGVAFRYEIPEQNGIKSVEVTDEPCRFRVSGDPQVWPLYRENYTTSHEGLYSHSRLSALEPGKLIDLPLLLQFDDGRSVAFTEANLRNYAGLYFKSEGVQNAAAEQKGKDPEKQNGLWLRCDLSPLPGQTELKVRANLPLVTPWRVIFLAQDPGRFIESNLILNLNEPSVISDPSWIKFGKTTWYWWNGPYQEPVDFKVGLNWDTMKHYIDFCQRNGIVFHSIMSTPDEFPWYVQTQKGYGPGPDTDITRARDGFPMERVTEYARSKGVGTRLWVHWKPLSEHLEEAFTQYEKWGIAGLMVDFLDRDDQEMVIFAEKVLQSAARHHLHIHFHGVWKPTGLQRTYPNLFNHEGVLNLEYLKWGNECSPPHNVTVPFTRMLAGPMDYHLGGFRSAAREQFKPVNMKPIVLGTRCQHLAMYVVYENPMAMVCDAPTAYEGQPGFGFIRQVPTSWDETRVLADKVGEYIVVARRRGSEWYLGAMTDWTAREIEAPLNFLGPGPYNAELYQDAEGADPNQLKLVKRTCQANDKLLLRLNPGGGQAVIMKQVENK